MVRVRVRVGVRVWVRAEGCAVDFFFVSKASHYAPRPYAACAAADSVLLGTDAPLVPA